MDLQRISRVIGSCFCSLAFYLHWYERKIGTTSLEKKNNATLIASPPSPRSEIPVTRAERCGFSRWLREREWPQPVTIPGEHYKAQSSEDRKLMEWFPGVCNGTYIEMGALDGVRYSNSHVFHKALGWRGVLVELMGDNYARLARNRPDEIATIHAGVCDRPRRLHYFGPPRGHATGGIYEFVSPSFRERWWGGVPLDDPRVGEVDCDTLDRLLREHAPGETYFDFFSLDVEGAELSVLEAIDYRRVRFGIVLVEADQHNQTKNSAVRRLLEEEGYIFLLEYQRSYWFRNEHFGEIYRDVVKAANNT